MHIIPWKQRTAQNISEHLLWPCLGQWNLPRGLSCLMPERTTCACAAGCTGTPMPLQSFFLYAEALVGKRTVHYGLVLCKWSRLAWVHQPLSPSKSDPSHPTNCSALGSGQRLKSNNGQCEEAYELEVVLGIRRAVTKRTLPHPSLSARTLRTKYCAQKKWLKFKQNRHECTSEIPPAKLPLPLQGLACETKLELKSENIIANQLIEQPMQHLCAKQKVKRLRPMNVGALLSLQPLCNVQHDSMCDLCSMYRATPSLQPAVGARTVDCGLLYLWARSWRLHAASNQHPSLQHMQTHHARQVAPVLWLLLVCSARAQGVQYAICSFTITQLGILRSGQICPLRQSTPKKHYNEKVSEIGRLLQCTCEHGRGLLTVDFLGLKIAQLGALPLPAQRWPGTSGFKVTLDMIIASRTWLLTAIPCLQLDYLQPKLRRSCAWCRETTLNICQDVQIQKPYAMACMCLKGRASNRATHRQIKTKKSSPASARKACSIFVAHC